MRVKTKALETSDSTTRPVPQTSVMTIMARRKVEKGDQILSRQCRPQPFEPLDAVGDHPLPAREKPAAGNIQPENGDPMKEMTTTWTT